MTEFRDQLTQYKGVELGKMPPQAVDLEESILGSILLERGAIAQVSGFLEPEMFYNDQNKEIYKAILELDGNNEPIDMLTVTDKLRKRGSLEFVGGPVVVTQLTNKVGSAANLDYHAKVVAESWVSRELIATCTEVGGQAYEPTSDIFELMDSLQATLTKLYNGTNEANYEKVVDILPKAISRIEEIQKSDNKLIGVPSGNVELDRVLNGFVDTRLIVVAARTSMGKTTKMISWAYKATVEFNYPTLIFSLEQDKVELVLKLLSAHTGVDHGDMAQGTLMDEDWKVINEKMSQLEGAELYIEDRPKLSPQQIKAISRRLVNLYGIKFILIDYLQIMGTNLKNPTKLQQVDDNAQFCKALAKELGVPVIAFAQLSRAVEHRGGSYRPILSDLKESGAIEENADQVIFLHRPEYYGISQVEGVPTEGLMELIVAKNRHGKTKTVREKSNLGTSSFEQENLPQETPKVDGPKQTNFLEENTDEDVPF